MQQFLQNATAALMCMGTALAVSIPRGAGVQTTSGQLIGHQASNRPSVNEFLGIRFAEAPVGELRFAAPKAFIAEAGTVFEASEWSPDCPSNKPPVSAFPNFTPQGLRIWKNFAAQNSNPSSEDCLKLNVWTKNTDNSSAQKPVLVYFHGGRFQIPGPHSPYYNGEYLADAEDVVVVTTNFRLGMFGFPGGPGLEANAALRDQRLAVEWVRDNIAAFGGDPSKITIFGQSAGGASVDYWSFAYKEDPIVAGLIPMAGTSLSFLPNTQDYSRSLFYNVSGTVGCGGPSDDVATVISCVRSKNTTEILAAAAKAPPLPTTAIPQATFHPTVDDVLVFEDYEALTKAGSFAKIPMLAGNNDHEDGWYRLAAFGAKVNLTEDRWDLYTQRAFTCPNSYTTDARVQACVPTWRYRYHGDFDNLRLYNGSAGLGPKGSAAYHGVETAIVFGTSEDVTGIANSPEEDATIKLMQGAWGAFARDPEKGLEGYGWPAYKKEDATLVEIALNNNPEPTFVNPSKYDSVCPEKSDPLPGRGAF